MLIKFFLCSVIFISSIQNSFGLENLSSPATKLQLLEDSSAVKQPQISKFQEPPGVVYRVDSRPLEAIIAAGGFSTWTESTGNLPDNNLANHAASLSLDDRRSNFISTSANFEGVMRHIRRLYYVWQDDFEPVYIYRIRPNANFFDVNSSVAEAVRRAEPNSTRWENLNELLENVGEFSEFAAHGAIAADRIISVSTAITPRFLQLYGVDDDSPIFEENFGQYYWFANPTYNAAYDNDRASAEIFSNVEAVGMEAVPILNDTVVDIEPRFSCYGVGFGSGPSSKQINLLPPCSVNEKLNFITVPRGSSVKMAMLIASQLLLGAL